MKALTSAFRASLPVAFGYFPLGLAFGILLTELGHSWVVAFLMGLLVYAGAAQFFALTLLRGNAPLFDFAVMALFINIRHIFYGLSFLDVYRPLSPRNVYLAGTLTDETYSILTTDGAGQDRNPRFYLYVSALNHAYWTLSCALGGIVGQLSELKVPELEFALPCLFIVLATEQIRSRRRYDLATISMSACLFGIVVGGNGALFMAIALSCAFLVYEGSRRQWRILQ